MPMTLKLGPEDGGFAILATVQGISGDNVQAINLRLLEICGPLFMSHPGNSNVQFRLKEQNGFTYLRFTHRAMAQLFSDASSPRIGHE